MIWAGPISPFRVRKPLPCILTSWRRPVSAGPILCLFPGLFAQPWRADDRQTGDAHRAVRRTNAGAAGKDPDGFPADEITIADSLRQNGYHTIMYGKWHLGNQAQDFPTRHGFDEWFGIPISNDCYSTCVDLFDGLTSSDPQIFKNTLAVVERATASRVRRTGTFRSITLIVIKASRSTI